MSLLHYKSSTLRYKLGIYFILISTVSKIPLLCPESSLKDHNLRTKGLQQFTFYFYFITWLTFINCLIYHISVYHHLEAPSAAPTKKPRFGPRIPRIGSQGWWYHEAQKEGKGYTKLWDHLTEYKLARNKALAELDNKILGFQPDRSPRSGHWGRGYWVSNPIFLQEHSQASLVFNPQDHYLQGLSGLVLGSSNQGSWTTNQQGSWILV
jgi:hypothetical protein